jgi:oligoendopeptidase F
MRSLSLAALALVAALPAFAADGDANRWKLADLYPTLADWHADAAKLDAELKDFSTCKSRMGERAASLRRCLDRRADMTKRYYRLAVYAGELWAEDTGNASSLELDQKADVLGARLTEATSFVDPALLRIGREKIARFMKQDPKLAIHRHPVEGVLRRAPHTLNDEGEALVAAFDLMNNAGGSVHQILTNADIPWPKVKLSSGEEPTIDLTGYETYRESQVREDRRAVMEAFFRTFRTYERTLGVTLYAQLKQDTVHSKVRKYPDSITRALDRNNVPVAVIDTLIGQANASLPTLHRYFRLRARMLGVPQLHYYDIYPPLVKGEYRFPYAEGRAMFVDAMAPLGKDYVTALNRALDARWMDLYPRPKKLSGAHVAGAAYDVHPYVLMNYTDDYSSLTTLAHEWGHAMHSYLASAAQPFVTANYATFTAEIASTVNEAFLLQHMLRKAKSAGERLFYLGNALETLRGTFHRQAMFAEFERAVHARVDRGEPMTGEAFSKTYCEILKRYHGTSQGVVEIADDICVEWAYIPHFYSPFYVYQYATSIAAAQLFAKRIADGEPGALGRYLGLLKAGGSDDPYELVRAAGVDLAKPDPYQALVARMDAIMDEIEAILPPAAN